MLFFYWFFSLRHCDTDRNKPIKVWSLKNIRKASFKHFLASITKTSKQENSNRKRETRRTRIPSPLVISKLHTEIELRNSASFYGFQFINTHTHAHIDRGTRDRSDKRRLAYRIRTRRENPSTGRISAWWGRTVCPTSAAVYERRVTPLASTGRPGTANCSNQSWLASEKPTTYDPTCEASSAAIVFHSSRLFCSLPFF